MTPDQFVQTRQAQWQLLSDLIDKAERNITQLSARQIEEVGVLYRNATSDLALAQRDFPGHRVTEYLNQLVARSHATIYRSKPLVWSRIWRFVTTDYPRLFRDSLPFFVTALLLFFIPAIIVGTINYLNPEAVRWTFDAASDPLVRSLEEQELWVNFPVSERPYAAAYIGTNNIRVSFLAFAGGALAGVFTIFIMISNGVSIGGILGLAYHHGVGVELTNFIIGHGVIELTVIFIAGGTGLMLGWSIVRPGLQTRRESISTAARKAVGLISGAVPLLIIAALIEGFISPELGIPAIFKYATGIGTGILLYGYLFFSGRGETTESLDLLTEF